jgi:hypothetical protein
MVTPVISLITSKTKKIEMDKIIALGNSFMSLSNISKGLV